jgi:hypothetical protein
MSSCYIGEYRVKLTDGKWQVIYRPDYTVVHECADGAEAIRVAIEKAGLKGAFDASGFAGVGKEEPQC